MLQYKANQFADRLIAALEIGNAWSVGFLDFPLLPKIQSKAIETKIDNPQHGVLFYFFYNSQNQHLLKFLVWFLLGFQLRHWSWCNW